MLDIGFRATDTSSVFIMTLVTRIANFLGQLNYIFERNIFLLQMICFLNQPWNMAKKVFFSRIGLNEVFEPNS